MQGRKNFYQKKSLKSEQCIPISNRITVNILYKVFVQLQIIDDEEDFNNRKAILPGMHTHPSAISQSPNGDAEERDGGQS